MDYSYFDLSKLTPEQLKDEADFQHITDLITGLNHLQPDVFTEPVTSVVRPKYELSFILEMDDIQWKSLANLCQLSKNTSKTDIIFNLASHGLLNETATDMIRLPSFVDVYNLSNDDLKDELNRRDILYVNRYKAIVDLLTNVESNPYINLSDDQLLVIADGRRICNNNDSDLMSLLIRTDSFDSDWLNKVQRVNLLTKEVNIEDFADDELLYYMAYNRLLIKNTKIELHTIEVLRSIANIVLRCGKLISYQQPKSETDYRMCNVKSTVKIPEIYDLINKGNYLPENILDKHFPKQEIDKLYRYPVRANDPFSLSFITEDILIECVLLLTDQDVSIYKHDELVFILSRCYLPNIQLNGDRYNKINTLNDFQLSLLCKVNDIKFENRDITVRRLTRLAENDLEKFIFELTNDNIDTVCWNFGMVIPSNIDSKGYVVENVYDYRNCVNRVDSFLMSSLNDLLNYSEGQLKVTLSYYKDYEIFNVWGSQFHYTSRINLIDQAINMLNSDNQFFIPLERRCYNETTAVMFDDTKDLSNYIIGYGNIKRDYLGFGTVELESYFSVGDDGEFKFAKPIPDLPSGKSEYFTFEEVRLLKSLLIQYSDENEDIPIVIEKIDAGIAANVQSDAKAKRFRDFVRDFNDEVKELLKTTLILLFESGMYARRWKGPGNPYPLAAEHTETPMSEDEINSNLSIALATYNDQLIKLPSSLQSMIYSSCTYKLVNGNLERLNNLSIRDLLHKLAGTSNNSTDGSAACMRVGSAIVVGTAYYYLRLLCHHTMPDFDELQIDSIA